MVKSGRRFVVLQFDDGDRFDYEPPLPHPADSFLERFPTSPRLNADIGATSAVEVVGIDDVPQLSGVLYPLSPEVSRAATAAAFRRWTRRGLDHG